jgi:hypothetical protein
VDSSRLCFEGSGNKTHFACEEASFERDQHIADPSSQTIPTKQVPASAAIVQATARCSWSRDFSGNWKHVQSKACRFRFTRSSSESCSHICKATLEMFPEAKASKSFQKFADRSPHFPSEVGPDIRSDHAGEGDERGYQAHRPVSWAPQEGRPICTIAAGRRSCSVNVNPGCNTSVTFLEPMKAFRALEFRGFPFAHESYPNSTKDGNIKKVLRKQHNGLFRSKQGLMICAARMKLLYTA